MLISIGIGYVIVLLCIGVLGYLVNRLDDKMDDVVEWCNELSARIGKLERAEAQRRST